MKQEVFLNRYQAVRLLGEGGMGQVFLGRQLDNGRTVVIKVMHERFTADARFRKAFQREMVLMMRFRHPNAVALFDASLEDCDRPCIVMEYVPGLTLEQLIEKHRRLPPLRMGLLLGQLCQVLQAAHENGIVHRDLTPVNVMVMHPDSHQEQVKVMDFGLAQMGEGPYIRLERLRGDTKSIGGGTPDYVSPEQVRGEEVDYRADIYSLGVLLFKALTGFLPFEKARTTEEILQAHMVSPPPHFREMGAQGIVPVAVEEVVHACLAKKPAERPQSALEVAARFEKALGKKIIFGEPVKATLLPPPKVVDTIDPRTVMDHLEAFMPEPIAVVKLRGFVHDVGGEFIDSEPGIVRFRLPDPAVPAAASSSGLFSVLGLKKKAATQQHDVTLELRMEKKSKEQRNILLISVLMIPSNRAHLNDPAWRGWSQQLCRELRAYLISR